MVGEVGLVGLVGFGMWQNYQSGVVTAQKIVHLRSLVAENLLTHLLTHRPRR